MPRQAFGLKKYLRGTSRVSKMSDNEHTTPPLSDSEKLAVQDAVGPPIPAVRQPSDDNPHIPSTVRAEQTRDVFEKNPGGKDGFDDAEEGEPQTGSGASKSAALSSHGQILAGKSADEHIRSNKSIELLHEAVDVRELRHRGPVTAEYRQAGGVLLALP